MQVFVFKMSSGTVLRRLEHKRLKAAVKSAVFSKDHMWVVRALSRILIRTTQEHPLLHERLPAVEVRLHQSSDNQRGEGDATEEEGMKAVSFERCDLSL